MSTKPLGQLVPLRTRLETTSQDLTVDVYIIQVPAQAANRLVKSLSNALPEDALNLQHLRRLTKAEFVPSHLEIYPPGTQDPATVDEPVLSMLVCSTNLLLPSALQQLLSDRAAAVGYDVSGSIRTISVPRTAPTSEEQAKTWSEKYWPTVYRRSNPFGAHPSIVERAQREIEAQAPAWMSLARQAGEETKLIGVGENVGVVVVDKNAPGGPKAVVVAGDARWGSCADRQNPLAHAVMRGIGMVGRQRVDLARRSDDSASLEEVDQDDDHFFDTPMTDLEKAYHRDSSLAPGGYLCLDLDIYISHEPCVMCAMAILHSRFGRVVFGRRMPGTGGLTAETADNGLGYGMFWRHELNWKLLAWQYLDEDSCEGSVDEVFHA